MGRPAGPYRLGAGPASRDKSNEPAALECLAAYSRVTGDLVAVTPVRGENAVAGTPVRRDPAALLRIAPAASAVLGQVAAGESSLAAVLRGRPRRRRQVQRHAGDQEHG